MPGIWKRVWHEKTDAESDIVSQVWGSSENSTSSTAPPAQMAPASKNIGIFSATAMGVSLMMGS
ncbi:hypothetical protein IWW43_004661, partial [Coemansia sp. RSA 1935]